MADTILSKHAEFPTQRPKETRQSWRERQEKEKPLYNEPDRQSLEIGNRRLKIGESCKLIYGHEVTVQWFSLPPTICNYCLMIVIELFFTIHTVRLPTFRTARCNVIHDSVGSLSVLMKLSHLITEVILVSPNICNLLYLF